MFYQLEFPDIFDCLSGLQETLTRRWRSAGAPSWDVLLRQKYKPCTIWMDGCAFKFRIPLPNIGTLDMFKEKRISITSESVWEAEAAAALDSKLALTLDSG